MPATSARPSPSSGRDPPVRSVKPMTAAPATARTTPIITPRVGAIPITSQAITATHYGVVATSVTLAAMLVKLSELIQVAKCNANEAPAATVNHAALPRIGVRRSALMVMGSTTTEAISIRYKATANGGPSANLTRMAAKLM